MRDVNLGFIAVGMVLVTSLVVTYETLEPITSILFWIAFLQYLTLKNVADE